MLKIAFSDYDALRRHGEESYPHECCGILLGRVEGDSRFVLPKPVQEPDLERVLKFLEPQRATIIPFKTGTA